MKGKTKDRFKIKKVRTVEEPIAPSGFGKLHKRFSSLNSLPNAFKRSPKLEEKKKTDNSIVHPSDRKVICCCLFVCLFIYLLYVCLLVCLYVCLFIYYLFVTLFNLTPIEQIKGQ